MNLQGRNLTQGLSGADVAALQSTLVELGYTIPAAELQASSFSAGTLAAVEQFQAAHGLPANGAVDAATAAALTAAIQASTYVVKGTVSSPVSAGVSGLSVQLVDKNVGSDVAVATATTDKGGNYAITAVIGPATLNARHKTQPDLQVRVSARAAVNGIQTFLAASTVTYNAPKIVTLDVTLPADATGLPSEYETLTGTLAAVYAGKLGALQETSTQQDITFLANKTGWDARAVAMAALADQFGEMSAPSQAGAQTAPVGNATTTLSLRPEFYYALFRAGLPANADLLFQTGLGTVQAIWQQAIAQGVIPRSLVHSLETATQTFQALSAAHTLTMTPTIGLSTLGQALTPLLTNVSQQNQFAQLLTQYRDDWTNFWPAVERTLGATLTTQLKFLGQLHYLTINNAPLVAALNNAEARSPLTGPVDLASRGYYDAAKWAPLIGGSIPPGIPGNTPAEQAGNYARLLAAQVRISFPTAVLADQIKRGIVPIADTAAVASEVATFLAANQGQLEIGVEPIGAFIARQKAAAPSAPALAQIKRVQRVYQLTRDDASMSALLRHNLDSAYAITRYGTAGFVRAFADKLGGAHTATAVHLRAKQIFSSTLNIAAAYANARIAPTLGGASPTHRAYALPNNAGTASVTLEELFGSLDYCNCSDCNSILSPAAYLVDLLHYIDQPSPTANFLNPQSVLFQRRPDLQYLPLTCENTNTALPYIDIVNETLEYFVANGLSLQNYQGHDTGSTVTSAELLASPQYVSDTAYTALQNAFFPAPLPFNRPLELLRLQLQNLGVAVPDAMIALRANDNITDRTTPTSYGWSDILIEQLGISRDEYRLFTDATRQLGDLYGIPAAPGQTPPQWNAAVLTTLQTMSLQDLSRRVAVSYANLVAILETQFINPNAILIPRLQLLNAPFSTLQTLHDNLNTLQDIAPQFIAALPAGLDATQYGGHSPTDYQAVVNWVTSAQVYPLVMSLITIANPSGIANDCSGAALQLRYSNPDNTKNLLTATDFLKLIRFIRLWRKLQPLLNNADDTVTIAQIDAILTALYPVADLPVQSSNPANDTTNRPRLDAGFGVTLMRAGFLFQVMDRLSLTAARALRQLLACWAPIGTAGQNALYRSMFLTPTLLQEDPGVQSATVSNAINTGDLLTTQINNVVITHTVASGETAAAVASKIAGLINADTAVDQVSGLSLHKRFLASAQGNVIIIKAGFALSCSVSGAMTEVYAAAMSTPTSQSATVGGTATPGDVLTTTIDTIQIHYTVAADDTPAKIAHSIANAINGTTLAHPYSGLPLNNIVTASAANSGVITINAANAGAPFTLACSIQSANAGRYDASAPIPAGYTATVNGSITAGDVLVTTINGVAIPYTAVATDTTTTTLAASIAATINKAVEQDPATLLPISSLVHAISTDNIVTINPIDPSTAFTMSCSVTTGTETYGAAGPFSASQTARISGPIPAAAVLTTTINGLNVYYTVMPGDTPPTIGANVANAINNTTAADPVTNLPLRTVVSAAASGGAGSFFVTITAADATTSFTLTVSLSAESYTAGRLPPPFADNGYGVFLADTTQTLFGHEPLLCAACNLTGAEFALIAEANGFDATTPLKLDNVSALFRYGWLAHALNLSVREFLLLSKFAGLNPFAPLDPGTSPVEPPIIRFIRLLQAMRAAGLKSVQALYLMWNQDIGGTSAPKPADVTGLAFALRADFAAVEAQFTRQDDPDGSIAKGLMALVYGTTATDFFFGLLDRTFSVAVPYSYASPTLPQPVIDASGGSLAYNDLSKQLSFSGVLDTAAQDAIVAAATVKTTDSTDNVVTGNVTLTPAAMTNIVPGTALLIDSGAAQEKVAVTAVTQTGFITTTAKAHNGTATPFPIVNDPSLIAALGTLAAANQQAIAPFFATYPELQPLYTAYAKSTDPVQTRRTNLLNSFLPTLKRIRKEEQALAAITAAVGSDPSFANALLQDPTILHADADPTAPAVMDLTAIESSGLSAQFFATISGTIAVGTVLTTTINGNGITYVTTAADTSLAILAGNVAAAINATVTLDLTSGLPINRLVSAASAGNVIVISGQPPMTASSVFSLDCSSSTGALSYNAGTQLPMGAGGSGTIAGIWSGYITVPQDGSYNFAVVTDAGATVNLQIDGESAAMAAIGGVSTNQSEVTLVAGALVPVVLTSSSIKMTLELKWQSPPGLGWELVPGQYLYPRNLVERLGNTYVRFLKATSLASALSLVADEIAYLGTDTSHSINTTCANAVAAGNVQFTPRSMTNIAHGSTLVIDAGSAQETVTVTAVTATTFSAVTIHAHDGTVTPFRIVSRPAPDIGRGWLNFLPSLSDPTSVNLPTPDLATAARLGHVLTALLDFARVKQALSPNDERLLEVLQDPGALLPNGETALISLTGWAQVSVNALLTQFFGSISLTNLAGVENFCRVYDAYQLVRTCRVAASTLIAAVTNAPTVTTVSALQSALRALYAESDWLTIVRPINDAIRIRQRDALVAYILQGLIYQPAPLNAIGTADKLFEFFLIDPETQPPVETSRIRLALSTVQLFIERIVRNLEPQVSPSDIDAAQWQWMKRYRVWQANREVFLWPENWLYPELRDDQSPFFQQVMSSLLQSDITDDAASEAYLEYLTSLEEVAKLEPCGLYYVAATADSDEISYVVARTAGAHRKYYFRQLQNGSWTPWTEVKIDCEDMPLTPIVWNGRLFLFWLKVIKQSVIPPGTVPSPSDPAAAGETVADVSVNALLAAGPSTSGAATQVAVGAVLCWSEFYNGKWQPTKTSDMNRPATIGIYDVTGPGSFDVDRDRVRIVPAQYTGESILAKNFQVKFTLPDGALILTIVTPTSVWFSNGFVMYNTHGLPVRLEDILVPTFKPSMPLSVFLDTPAEHRTLAPAQPYTGAYDTDTFTIAYADTPDGAAVRTNDILGFNWMPRYVEPQPGLANAWDAPFIYEDRRYQFYVTTQEDYWPFGQYTGFGAYSAVSAHIKSAAKIPGLVLAQTPPPGDPAQNIVAGQWAGSDPAVIRRDLMQKSDIRVAFRAGPSVSYQGKNITPVGSQIGADLKTTSA